MYDYLSDIATTVEENVPERDGYVMMVRGGGFGFVRIMLNDPGERERSQQAIADDLTGILKKKTKARSFVMQQSTFGGRRAGLPVQYVLQATSIEKLRKVLPEFMAKVTDNPTFEMADVNLKFTNLNSEYISRRKLHHWAFQHRADRRCKTALSSDSATFS
jgi:multidrug efflux pump